MKNLEVTTYLSGTKKNKVFKFSWFLERISVFRKQVVKNSLLVFFNSPIYVCPSVGHVDVFRLWKKEFYHVSSMTRKSSFFLPVASGYSCIAFSFLEPIVVHHVPGAFVISLSFHGSCRFIKLLFEGGFCVPLRITGLHC